MLRLASLVLSLALLSCKPLPVPLKISEIVADPARFEGQILQIQGEAVDGYGLLSLGVYDFSDGSGEIAVITTKGMPSLGSRFLIRGTVITGFTVGGKHYGVAIRESERVY